MTKIEKCGILLVGLNYEMRKGAKMKGKLQRKRKRLTRVQFERLITGKWESHHGDRVRINGPFVTSVSPGKKNLFIVHGKNNQMVSKRTWLEVAKEILPDGNN